MGKIRPLRHEEKLGAMAIAMAMAKRLGIGRASVHRVLTSASR